MFTRSSNGYLRDMTEPAKAQADFSKPVVFYVAADGQLRHDLSAPEIRDVIQKGIGELWIDMRVTSRQRLR